MQEFVGLRIGHGSASGRSPNLRMPSRNQWVRSGVDEYGSETSNTWNECATARDNGSMGPKVVKRHYVVLGGQLHGVFVR